MTKRILAFILMVYFGPAPATAQSDRELVYSAVEDYVEALYRVEPERIKRSVHPNLTKRGFWRPNGTKKYEPESTMTFEELLDLAAKWNAQKRLPIDAPKKIEIYDVQDQTATAKLTAEWGTDYLQLAKYGAKWMIVNILWQSHPSKSN